MKRPVSAIGFCLCFGMSAAILGIAAPAHAQVAQLIEGEGIKVGEGTVIHPIVGIETGVVSNVFFTDSNEDFSGLLRVLGEAAMGSLSEERMADADSAKVQSADGATDGSAGDVSDTANNPGEMQYRAELKLAYEEYLSTNSAVRTQRNIAGIAHFRALVHPLRTWNFGFDDTLTRETRPTNYESRGNLDRDINSLRLQMNYQPAGRSIGGYVRYENTIDSFEGSQHDFANRFQNKLEARANWRWLPFTQFYGLASIGLFTGLGDSAKATSLPLRVLAGLQSVLTVDTTVNTYVGYGHGFYSSGEDFSNLLFAAQFGYRFSPYGRLTAMYSYDFDDSINANFYRDHTVKVQMDQQINQTYLRASAELRFRGYRGVPAFFMGPPDRDDVIFAAGLEVTHNFRHWLQGTLSYTFVTDQTDYIQAGDDPSYTRHELLAGVRGAI